MGSGSMSRWGGLLTVVVCSALAGGCSKDKTDGPKDAPSAQAAASGAATGAAAASGAATGATAATGSGAAVAVGDEPTFYGDDAAFERVVDGAEHMASSRGAGPHSPEEPDFFDVGWIGREAQDALNRAKKKELARGQLSTSNGTPCLVFHQNKLVRRMLVGNYRPGSPLEEFTFSQQGGLILWFASDHGDPATLAWAFFHRGNLKLYQDKIGSGARAKKEPPAGFDRTILATASDCLQRFGATNTAAPPAPEPPPEYEEPPFVDEPQPGEQPAPSGGARAFGALAYSQPANRWGVASQRTSQAEAHSVAIQYCGRADCKVLADFGQGQCIVVVHGPGSRPQVLWGYDRGVDGARSYAANECSKRGLACTEQGAYCND